jgi:hypothetical protein
MSPSLYKFSKTANLFIISKNVKYFYEFPCCNVGVEMANLLRLSVILLCCLFEAICVETDDSKFRDAAQFVLDIRVFNHRPDASYVYDSAKIINVHEKNDSVPSLYFIGGIGGNCHI